MVDAVTCTFDMSGIEADLDAMTKAVSDNLRPIAQAGAQAFYNEVRARVQPLDAAAVRHLKGGRTRPVGALLAAIYQVYSKDNSKDGTLATYHISWNARKAPHAHFLENGTSRMAARPFIRPAFDAVQAQALHSSEAELESVLKQHVGSTK